jgi:hypothetical protein
MYDPVIGRFLSPDPYVPNMSHSQDFNRYSYARNNPLKYTDPTGEFVCVIIIGAVVGAIAGAATASMQGEDVLTGMGTGAFIGAFTGGLSVVGAAMGICGVLSGSIYGAGTGAAVGGLSGGATAALRGNDVWNGIKFGAITGAITGGITGGIGGGISAKRMGFSNPWNVTLQDKLDYMMANQYKSQLVDAIGEGDAEVLVGNNKNLKGTGFRNENGNMVTYEDIGTDQLRPKAAHGLTLRGNEFSDGSFTRYSDNKIFLSKNTVRGLWRGDYMAQGTLFHEWQHANDNYTGTADVIRKISPNKGIAESFLEYRAYQWNSYSPGMKGYSKHLNSYVDYLINQSMRHLRVFP